MAGVTRLINALSEIAVPEPGDAFPVECDLGHILKDFFSRDNIKRWMVEMNQDQLYKLMVNRNGVHIAHYAERTLKRKMRDGKPYPYYSYYETGRTHDSLVVIADDDTVGVYLDTDAPDYSKFLEQSAWGLTDESFDELMPEMRDAVVDGIRNFLNNG